MKFENVKFDITFGSEKFIGIEFSKDEFINYLAKAMVRHLFLDHGKLGMDVSAGEVVNIALSDMLNDGLRADAE